MSLDSWLNLNSNFNADPPLAKRIRIDESFVPDLPPSVKLSSMETLPSAKTPQILYPPAKYQFNSVQNTQRNHDLLELKLGSCALHSWSYAGNYSIPQMLSCVQSIPQTSLVGVGGNSASTSLHLLDTDPSSKKVHKTSIDLPLAWPMNSMAAPNSHTLFCSSHRGVIAIDLGKELNITEVHMNLFDSISVIASKPNGNMGSSGGDNSLIAVGTDSGALNIWDTREKQMSRSWTHTHGIHTGPRANRINPPVAHISWCSDTVLATACRISDRVKFWDLRTRNPLMITQENVASTSSTRQHNSVGIHGMASKFGSGQLWALTSKGDIISLHSQQSFPDFRLKLWNSECYNRSISLLDNGYWPLVACGGKSGIALITEPSSVHRGECNIDMIRATKFPGHEYIAGHEIETSALAWQPVSKTFVCLDTIGGCQMYSQSKNNHIKSRPLRVKQLPIHVK